MSASLRPVDSELRNGERQVAPTVAEIRADHVDRYRWAARTLPPGSRVVDLACGVGYGAAILADAGHTVMAVDRSHEAIGYAMQHYRRLGIDFEICKAESVDLGEDTFDAAVCFEAIEHFEHPIAVLRKLERAAPIVLASVPNEDVFPHRGKVLHHHRHYTRDQFDDLLRRAGLKATSWHGQAGAESSVEPEIQGRTLIAAAARSGVPYSVALLGLGPSVDIYLDMTKRLGSRDSLADEVWAINALGDVLCCDRIFHMDDVRIQEIRAEASPDGNTAAMLPWLRRHPGPIYTSRPHPDYPGMVEFPLEDVLNSVHYGYFNSTAAYAVAYAIHIGVRKIHFFGIDFSYPNMHAAEMGRACVEFWLGMAAARGIAIVIARSSSLMDACEPEDRRFYGYDTLKVEIEQGDDGLAKVTMVPRDTVPTAEEIEERYDHSIGEAA